MIWKILSITKRGCWLVSTLNAQNEKNYILTNCWYKEFFLLQWKIVKEKRIIERSTLIYFVLLQVITCMFDDEKSQHSIIHIYTVVNELLLSRMRLLLINRNENMIETSIWFNIFRVWIFFLIMVSILSYSQICLIIWSLTWLYFEFRYENWIVYLMFYVWLVGFIHKIVFSDDFSQGIIYWKLHHPSIFINLYI